MKGIGEASNEMESRIEATIASMDDWQNCSISYALAAGSVVSPIHRAVENACYTVLVDRAETYFMKAQFDDMKDFTNFSETAEICSQLDDLGITPSLRSSNKNTRTMVFDYLGEDWSWGKVDDLADPDILGNVIKVKKTIQEGTPFNREQSVFDLIRSYWSMVDQTGAFVPADVGDIIGKISVIEKMIQASGVDIRPSHADGTASNIMIGPGKSVQLVDFDWSANTDPHYDLATLMVEAFQAEDDMWRMVEIFDGSVNERIYNRCRLYGIADDLMWALWGFVSFKKSPRVEVEFTKYAEWRLLRCRMNLDDPNFKKWLGKV